LSRILYFLEQVMRILHKQFWRIRIFNERKSNQHIASVLLHEGKYFDILEV